MGYWVELRVPSGSRPSMGALKRKLREMGVVLPLKSGPT
jgi:hypothetical protein